MPRQRELSGQIDNRAHRIEGRAPITEHLHYFLDSKSAKASSATARGAAGCPPDGTLLIRVEIESNKSVIDASRAIYRKKLSCTRSPIIGRAATWRAPRLLRAISHHTLASGASSEWRATRRGLVSIARVGSFETERREVIR